jgi:2-polyprenyl-6-methoxyphenol hydroxylase-like FAD-dependent oxidoreductase
MTTDIIIIGGGLAGTSAAIVLANAGHDVALIDARADYPPEFRAEKMGRPHMDLFERLGLGAIARAHCTPYGAVSVARFGRIVSEEPTAEFGFAYADLVNGLRAALPARARLIVGRVADMATNAERQRVTLADGRVIEGRLLVLATGLGDTLKRKLGIERVVESRAHSLSLGFTLAAPTGGFPFESLVWYGEGPRDRVSYLTIFPTRSGPRANLFVYREAGEDWVARFRAAPRETLLATMPRLENLCGDFAVTGAVAARSIDLAVSRGHERDGVVLIGDAYETCCPIVGVGIMKVLTDVEALCLRHLPGWLETPGMGADKIASYYRDDTKRAQDAKGLAASHYARAIAVAPGLPWVARRLRNGVARRGLLALREARRLVTKECPRDARTVSP